MDLQTVAHRIANKNTQLVSMTRTASKGPPGLGLPQVKNHQWTKVSKAENRDVSECQVEFDIIPGQRNLSQDEFIAIHKMAGEPEMDFADVLVYADEHDMEPEEVFEFIATIMNS